MINLTQFLLQYGYIGLFLAAFLSGSILPFASEAIFLALLIKPFSLDPASCLFWASFGNFLGGVSCYYLGSLGNVQSIKKILNISPAQLKRALGFLQNKEQPAWAFFTFLPIIGDLIAVSLGFLQINYKAVFIYMYLGKLSRYLFILVSFLYFK